MFTNIVKKKKVHLEHYAFITLALNDKKKTSSSNTMTEGVSLFD